MQIVYKEIHERSYESISGLSSAVFLWYIEKVETQNYHISVIVYKYKGVRPLSNFQLFVFLQPSFKYHLGVLDNNQRCYPYSKHSQKL